MKSRKPFKYGDQVVQYATGGTMCGLIECVSEVLVPPPCRITMPWGGCEESPGFRKLKRSQRG